MMSFGDAAKSAGFRRGRDLTAALVALLLLGGCSAFDGLFGDDRPQPVSQAGQAQRQAASQGSPNLGNVPPRPTATPTSDRRALEQGLAADRDQARYTDDQLRGRAAAAPPPPAPASAAGFGAPPPAPGAAPSFGAASQARPPQPVPGNPYAQRGPAPAGIPAYPGQETVAQTYAQALQQASASQLPTETVAGAISGADGTQVAGVAPRPAANRFGPVQSTQVAVIVFGNGASALGERDRQIVSAVATEQKRTGAAVRVVGYSSSRTRDMTPDRHNRANYEISMRRAQAVARELARQGVPRASIFVEARADAEPIYHESMPQAEAYNRRAEVFLEQ